MHGLPLAKPEHPANGLTLDGWIPLGLENMNSVRDGKVV